MYHLRRCFGGGDCEYALRKSVVTRRGLCDQLDACGTGCAIERGETRVATEKTEDSLRRFWRNVFHVVSPTAGF